MKRRFLSTTVLILFAVLLVLKFPLWAFTIVLCSFIGLALNEFYLLLRAKDILVNRVLGIFIGLVIPLTVFFEYRLPGNWQVIFIPLICLFIFLTQFLKRNNNAVLVISTILFASFYISWFLSFIIKIRLLNSGGLLVFYLVSVVKSSDIGAYLIGSRFGRRSLISRISPKKTLEGLLGGLAFSILVSLISKSYLPQWQLTSLFGLGAILGALAQIGDLSESLIKRDCGAKDSGKLFPGLGGMLDLIDSFLFTAPVFYFYLKTII